jgi:hypothetical protein
MNTGYTGVNGWMHQGKRPGGIKSPYAILFFKIAPSSIKELLITKYFLN